MRYSEALKSQVLSEIESGAINLSQAKRKYGIGGSMTIQKWARKSGRFDLLSTVIRVEKPNEIDPLKALKEENRRLKEAIADLVLDRKIAESTLEVICEQQGWDIEEIKKKVGMPLPKEQSAKRKK